MFIFKCGFCLLLSSYIYSLCLLITQETKSLDTGLAFLFMASGAIAGKIIYDRYQHIRILGSLTTNPSVTSITNRIASVTASLLSLSFLVYLILFLLKVDSVYLTTVNILICGFGTLYMWMQGVITTYLSTLYYERNLMVLRQCLANVSFLILIVMSSFGSAALLLPKSSSSGIYFCLVVTSICSYVLAACFCIFILSFEKEYQYFAEGLRSEPLLDDNCSVDNSTLSDVDSIFGTQDLVSESLVIKGSITCAKLS